MDVRVRDYDPSLDALAVDALWRRVFGHPKGGQTLDWLFRRGPAGEAPRAVAELNGRVVAHAGGAPLRFLVDGEEVRAAYSVAAMTDPEARGRRLFFRVGEYLYAKLEREGFAFVAGFSNERSHRLMTGPLGRTPLRPFPWAVRILRPLGAARALLRIPSRRRWAPPPAPAPRSGTSRVRVEEGDPDDARLDVVWERAAQGIRVGAIRDSKFARWRYGGRPDARYRILIAESADGPAAWAALRILDVRGVVAGFLADLVVAPRESKAARSLLEAAEVFARNEGAHVMSALMPGGGATLRALHDRGYRRVPEVLHPQLIRFSVRGLGCWGGRRVLADPSAWHLSWADTDVV